MGTPKAAIENEQVMSIKWGAFRLRGILLAFSVLALIAGSFSPLFTASATYNGRTSTLPQEGEWYENWPGDENRNKIHDALEDSLSNSDIDPEEHVRVVADFDHKPTHADELRMFSSGWNILHVSKYVDSIILTLPSKDIDDLASWKGIVMIEYAPDGEFTLSSALPSIGVPEVWNTLGYYGEGVTICIIDTGIDDEHVGLDDMDDNPTTDDPKVIAFYDAQNHPNQDDGTYEPYDNHGHGTHCAGVAAGTGANNYNHIGVAPKAKLVGVKIGGGGIPYDAAMRGVEWAIDNKDKFGIDILSNSWGLYIGGPANQNGNSALSRLMDEAVDAGLIVFCAAGNTAVSMTVYAPADSERAMAVGSVNDNHDLSFFSSQGPTADGRIKPDICAVGEGVSAPRANSGTGYVTYDGTSMACPMAAGVAALVLSANPDLEPDDVKQIYHETSEHNTDARFPVSPNNGYGWGVVDAWGAVKRARDLNMVFIDTPDVIHENTTVLFSTNTTYTRTEFTFKGEDGMRIIGDDEVYFRISIPVEWSVPTNITLTSEGDMEYDSFFQVPRIEDNHWIIEVEFHYSENVNASTEATPKATFESTTPTVDADTTYTLYTNITLNGINATKVIRNITVDNQDPPQIAIDIPEDGDAVAGIITIAGTAFDPDVGDSVESVEISINGGDWIPADGTDAWDYLWDTLPLTNGQYHISARAYDGDEYSEIFNITINLDNFNLQPTALIDIISPNPANEGEVVSLSGYGTDDDGYIIDYEWKSTIDDFLSNVTSFSTAALSVGVHSISFRVKDEDGVWSQKAEASLRINQIPLAYIDSIAPNPADEGEWVSFAGHGNDDNDIVAYNWRSNLDGVLSGSASFSTSTMTTGDHDIYFRVQDDDGVWSSEVSANLRINQIPLSFIDSISPNPARQGENVTFAGHGTDDGSIVFYEWTSSIDDWLDSAATFSSSSLSLGEHVIAFRVLDNDNAWSDYTFLNLKVNPVPVAFIDSIAPNPANQGDTVSFQGHGEDVGQIISYNWRSDWDGFLSDLASFSTTDLSSNMHTIYFSVENDNNTWSDEVAATLRINGPPTAVIDTISPNPAVLGDDVLLSGYGEDDGNIINYSWRSSIDTFLASTATVITNELSLGEHTIYFSVEDDDGMWSDEVTNTLRIHRRPTAHIDSVSPNPANEGDVVSFSGHGTDDGSIAAYEWFSDLAGANPISTDAEFDSSTLALGDHDITFRVMDSDGVWSEFDSLNLLVNQIPVAVIQDISPNPANEGDGVTFTGFGTDDGVITEYRWTSSQNGYISSADSFTHSGLKPGIHEISLAVKDDHDVWSEDVFFTLRINRIPTAYITPPTPTLTNEGVSITFAGYGTDDGSIAAYNWTSSLNDFLSHDASFTISTLAVGMHEIAFSVMDDDGAWSQEVTLFLRINQIPTAHIDSQSSTSINKGDSISFSGHGTDDRDIRSHEWRSSLNGALSNSASFSTTQLSVGEHTIYFRVKDDDNIWSDEVTASVTVNKIPVAHIDPATDDSAGERDPVYFEGYGTDDGSITGYNWRSNIDGFLSDQPEFESVLSAGTHTVYFSVMDDQLQWSKEVTTRVSVNGLPVAYIDSVSPTTAYGHDDINLAGHGEDDGEIIAYEWTSSKDGEIGTSSSVTISGLSVGTHVIYFRVKDNKGVWSDRAKHSLEIELWINSAPSISLISPAHGDAVKDYLLIEATAIDPDDDVELIELRLDDNEWIAISDSNSAVYSLDISEITEGEHIVYVRAFDGDEYSTEEFAIVVVKSDEGEGLFSGGLGMILSALIVIIIIVIIILLLATNRRRQNNRWQEW